MHMYSLLFSEGLNIYSCVVNFWVGQRSYMDLLCRRRESLGMRLVISREIQNDYVNICQAKSS